MNLLLSSKRTVFKELKLAIARRKPIVESYSLIELNGFLRSLVPEWQKRECVAGVSAMRGAQE